MLNFFVAEPDSNLAKFHPAAAACCMTCIYNAHAVVLVRSGAVPTGDQIERLEKQAMDDGQELAGRVLGNRTQAEPVDGGQLLEASFRRGLAILTADEGSSR